MEYPEDLHICNPENFLRGQENMPSQDKTESLAETFKVFADPTRLRILFALKDNDLCVCDLSILLDMTQSSISHQLKTLREAKLVKGSREGKFMVYSLDDDHIHEIIDTGLAHILEED